MKGDFFVENCRDVPLARIIWPPGDYAQISRVIHADVRCRSLWHIPTFYCLAARRLCAKFAYYTCRRSLPLALACPYILLFGRQAIMRKYCELYMPTFAAARSGMSLHFIVWPPGDYAQNLRIIHADACCRSLWHVPTFYCLAARRLYAKFAYYTCRRSLPLALACPYILLFGRQAIMRKICELYMPTLAAARSGMSLHSCGLFVKIYELYMPPFAAARSGMSLLFDVWPSGDYAQILRVIHAVVRYRSLWHVPTFFFSLIPPSRVVGEDFVAEDGAVEVEVDFGGLDAFVTEHLLDGAQIGAAFEQVSRK